MYLVDVRAKTIEEVELVEEKKGCGSVIKKGKELWFVPFEDNNCFLCETRESAEYNLEVRTYPWCSIVPQ